MLRQAIDLPGVGNARELGGYAIGDAHVKGGVLLRTAALAKATPEAIQRLRDDYRLQTVVDFRMRDELRYIMDPEVPGATNRALTVVEFEDYPVPEGVGQDDIERVFAFFKDPTTDRMQLFNFVYDFGMLGPEQYVTFLTAERGKRAFAAFFQELLQLEEDRAILWHCTDGKDRTGCAAMLVLSALGADRQTVLDDYLLTNEYNAAIVEAVRQRTAAYPMPKEKLDALLFMSGAVVEGYMTHAMDVLEEGYGSIEGYLRDELGVGAPELARLREKFLI